MPGWLQVVLHFVPQRRHAQRFFHALIAARRGLRTPFRRSPATTFSAIDIVGKRIRFLEDHADAPAHDRGIDLRRVEILAVEEDLPRSVRAPGVSSCMRLRQRRKVDLPQPLGPMMAVMCRDGNVERDLLHGLLFAVPDGEIARRESAALGGRRRGVARGRSERVVVWSMATVMARWS